MRKQVGRPRKSFIKAIRILAYAMHAKLARLVSKQRDRNQLAANKLLLILRGSSRKGIGCKTKDLCTIPIQLAANEWERTIVHAWHNVPRKLMISKMQEACMKRYKRLKLIAKTFRVMTLTACDIISVVVPRYTIEYDPAEVEKVERALRTMQEYHVPYDPYMPLDAQQTKILAGKTLKRPKITPEQIFEKRYNEAKRGDIPQVKIDRFLVPIRRPLYQHNINTFLNTSRNKSSENT